MAMNGEITVSSGHSDADKVSEDNSELTILDSLNEDCWRMVLDYVPVADIIKSKKVSQQWSLVVHRYLQDVGVCIEIFEYVFKHWNVKMAPKNRIAHLDMNPYYLHYVNDYASMEDFWREWGPYTVYTYCKARPELETISQYCPRLKALVIRLSEFGIGLLSEKQVELCEKLERLVLMPYTLEYYFANAANKPHLRLRYDDLKYFNMCEVKNEKRRNSRRNIVGREFLSNLRPTKLRSLTICGRFNYRYFFADVMFPELTELILQGCHTNVAMLLRKMSKLERLRVMDGHMKLCGDCPGLAHLTLVGNAEECLEEIMVRCGDLQTIELLGFHYAIKSSLKALRRSQSRVTVSCVLDYGCSGDTLNDDELVDLVAIYPYITMLDIRKHTGLTAAFLPRLARVQRQPMRLLVAAEVAAALKQDQVQHPGLTLEACEADEDRSPTPLEYICEMS